MDSPWVAVEPEKTLVPTSQPGNCQASICTHRAFLDGDWTVKGRERATGIGGRVHVSHTDIWDKLAGGKQEWGFEDLDSIPNSPVENNDLHTLDLVLKQYTPSEGGIDSTRRAQHSLEIGEYLVIERLSTSSEHRKQFRYQVIK